MSAKKNLFAKALSTEGDITKQEIFNILFVLKQIIGLILGVALGLLNVTGLTGLIAYTIVSYLIVYVYVMRFLQPEQQTVQAIDLFKEHWMMGFFAFLLPWIITFNFINF